MGKVEEAITLKQELSASKQARSDYSDEAELKDVKSAFDEFDHTFDIPDEGEEEENVILETEAVDEELSGDTSSDLANHSAELTNSKALVSNWVLEEEEEDYYVFLKICWRFCELLNCSSFEGMMFVLIVTLLGTSAGYLLGDNYLLEPNCT